MSCHGLHHACDCKQALEEDLIDALTNMVNGIEKLRSHMPGSERGKLKTEYHLHLDFARSVLRRANKI